MMGPGDGGHAPKEAGKVRVKAYGYLSGSGWAYLGIGTMDEEQTKQIFKITGRKSTDRKRSRLHELVKRDVSTELDRRAEEQSQRDWD